MKDEVSGRSIAGRGASGNVPNRFEKISSQSEPGEMDPGKPETVYLRDHSRSIIARHDSSAIGFDASVNPYRGCSHGCVYCLAGERPILAADGSTKRLEDVLKVWAHKVTPEEDSEGIVGVLRVHHDGETRQFDLKLSKGQVVLPVAPGELDITLAETDEARTPHRLL